MQRAIASGMPTRMDVSDNEAVALGLPAWLRVFYPAEIMRLARARLGR